MGIPLIQTRGSLALGLQVMQEVGALVVEVGEGAGGGFEAWNWDDGTRSRSRSGCGWVADVLLMLLELVAFGSGEGG